MAVEIALVAPAMLQSVVGSADVTNLRRGGGFQSLKFPLILLVVSLAYLAIGMNQDISIYDEGVSVQGAERVLSGDVPYKDFWTLYSPGYFYILAGLFRLFGSSLMVERVASITIDGVVCVSSFILASKVVSRRPALLTWFLCLTWLGTCRSFGSSLTVAVAWMIISCLVLHRYFSDRKPYRLFVAGVLAGMATLFRHDIGAYIVIAELTVVGIFVLTASEINDGNKFVILLKSCFLIVAGISCVLGPALVYFFSRSAMGEMTTDLLGFPSIYYRMRAVAYPQPSFVLPVFGFWNRASWIQDRILIPQLPYFLPFIIYPVTGLVLLKKFFSGTVREAPVQSWTALLLLALGCLVFLRAWVRHSQWHLIPTFICFSILFVWIISVALKRPGWKPFAYAVAAVILYLLSIAPVKERILMLGYIVPDRRYEMNAHRARGIYWGNAPAYDSLLQYIDSNVPEGQKIYVGNTRHDMIFYNDVMIYFLSERESATKYYELHPGLATTQQIQESIVRDIEGAQVRFVVLRDADENHDPNESSRSSGVFTLDRFIRDHFTQDQRIGAYTVWRR